MSQGAQVPAGATTQAGPGEAPSEAELRRAFSCFPSGVTALCALVDGLPVGMAASSFTSVSIEPPLVSVCVARSSATWKVLRTAERLGVSVLSEDHAAASRQLAASGVDRFAGLDWRGTADGAVFVGGSAALIDCSLASEVDAGDHLLALLRIHAVSSDPTVTPLVFHGSGFRRLVPHEPDGS